MRLLVVDDEALIRGFVCTVLTRQGYEVLEAENGLQALQIARCHSCDMVITDQVMPEMNGLQLIARLAMERYPARYLLVSGYVLGQQVPSGLAYLGKPFSGSQLLEKVGALRSEPTLPELEQDWKWAKKEWQETVMEITAIVSDVPSQIPHPDGILRIERAALKRDAAYDGYSEALRRYREALRSCGLAGSLLPDSER